MGYGKRFDDSRIGSLCSERLDCLRQKNHHRLILRPIRCNIKAVTALLPAEIKKTTDNK